MNITSLKNESLVELACKAIKQDITKRVLRPGERIVIRELKERYGVSETPIKQALHRLIIEGLIEGIPRRGMSVKEIKWSDIKDKIEARYMIETYCIEPALKIIKNNSVVRYKFTENLSIHKKSICKVDNVESYFKHFELDKQFHYLFVKCSHNKKLINIHENIGTHIYMYHIYGKQGKERVVNGLYEHQKIFNAALDKDTVNVKKYMKIHMDNTLCDMRELFNKETCKRNIDR